MVKGKKVQAVVVYKLDRMFRSTIDALNTTKQFNKLGIAFHSINESLDTQSAMGNFFFTLTAALAEMERAIIGERTSSALQFKIKNGEKVGGRFCTFGYDVAEGKLYRNETEQRALSLIHKLRHQCFSLRAICDELENQGYKTKSGIDQVECQDDSQDTESKWCCLDRLTLRLLPFGREVTKLGIKHIFIRIFIIFYV